MSENINLSMTKSQFTELLNWARQFEYTDDDTGRMLYDLLRRKMDKLVEREYFTKFKTAPTEAERDAGRRAYLREKGVPESNIGPYFHGEDSPTGVLGDAYSVFGGNNTCSDELAAKLAELDDEDAPGYIF